MKIRSIDKHIKDILESGFYRIQRFQRPYSWDRENIEDFWNDVIIKEDADYFIGGMVVFKPPSSDTAGVVDGQQRLTTITMILAALRNTFNDAGFADLAGGVHRLIERYDINPRLLRLIVPGSGLMTAGVDCAGPFAGTNRDDNTPAVVGEAGLPVNEAGKMMASVENGGNLHGCKFRFSTIAAFHSGTVPLRS